MAFHTDIVVDALATLRTYAKTLAAHGPRGTEKKTFAECVVEHGITNAVRFYARDELMAAQVAAFADDIEKNFAQFGGDEGAAREVRVMYAGYIAREAFDTSKRFDPIDLLIENTRRDAAVRACEALRVTVSQMLADSNCGLIIDAQEAKHRERQDAPASYTLTKAQGVYTLTVFKRNDGVSSVSHLTARNKRDALTEAAATIGPNFVNLRERGELDMRA